MKRANSKQKLKTMIQQLNNVMPTASITVNRNRLKTYGNAVYLKSGTNFEIEIFNPLRSRVLVSIEVDGKLISSTGLVINPGQREYLERWIDEPKKFKFNTYKVENTPEAKRAISDNGKVKVSFYEEANNTFFPSTNTVYENNTWDPNVLYCSSNISVGNLTTSGSGYYTRDMLSVDSRSKSVETGRAEKGDTSKQGFDSTTGDFNTWTTSITEIQILPESSKPVELEKIRMYCTGCGIRVRAASWKFCPSCGEKV